MDIEYVKSQLIAARKALNLKQEELAEYLKMPKANYGRLENGRTHITVETLIMLSNSLNVDISYFFVEEDYLSAVYSRKRVEQQSNPYAEIRPFIVEKLGINNKEESKKLLSGNSRNKDKLKLIKEIISEMEVLSKEGLQCVLAYLQGWRDRDKTV